MMPRTNDTRDKIYTYFLNIIIKVSNFFTNRTYNAIGDWRNVCDVKIYVHHYNRTEQ